jgi:predicted RNA-binding protein YlxR (DUF448 family)
MAQPVRTCAGCGRRAPQQELQRFGAVDGRLEPGRTVPGRGVYTCRSAACFRQALERRAFARVLRRPVHARPELERLYTDADG